MAAATDQQVQTYVNERFRVRAEQARALYLSAKDDKAAIDDIYAAVSAQTPTWNDSRLDGPPHLLTPNDVLAYNTWLSDFIAFVEGNAQWSVMLDACVRAVQG